MVHARIYSHSRLIREEKIWHRLQCIRANLQNIFGLRCFLYIHYTHVEPNQCQIRENSKNILLRSTISCRVDAEMRQSFVVQKKIEINFINSYSQEYNIPTRVSFQENCFLLIFLLVYYTLASSSSV